MPAGEPFSSRQRDELDRALKAAGALSGIHFRLYVGDLTGGRTQAAAIHAAADDASRSVLIALDPARRTLEIVTGQAAGHALDQRACTLGAMTMTSAFGQGDLFGGLVRGVALLGAHARRAPVLHTDEPF